MSTEFYYMMSGVAIASLINMGYNLYDKVYRVFQENERKRNERFENRENELHERLENRENELHEYVKNNNEIWTSKITKNDNETKRRLDEFDRRFTCMLQTFCSSQKGEYKTMAGYCSSDNVLADKLLKDIENRNNQKTDEEKEKEEKWQKEAHELFVQTGNQYTDEFVEKLTVLRDKKSGFYDQSIGEGLVHRKFPTSS